MSTPDAPTTPTVVWPTLFSRDAPTAIRFLIEAFGFEEAAVYPGEAPGRRDFVVRDPKGVYWSFGTYAGQ
jgi:uncharacterized glyoxalase superfamily protein PhnB